MLITSYLTDRKQCVAKLEQIGVNGTLLNLFRSYLSDRKQCVIVDGEKSNLLEVKAGVPQGSRLGPLLFIIYINDIVKDIESEIMIFADDTTLLASASDPAETSAQLNRDLEKLAIWADTWKVTYNSSKSKDLIFSNKQLNNSPPLKFNGQFIDRVNTHKHLGVYLQSNLQWSTQIKESCLKANRKLSVLRNVKMLKRRTLDLLYKVTVRSVIDYALPIYANNLKQTEITRLEQLQYRAAKLVTGALHFTSREKLNVELGWETIKKRIEFLSLTLFHKIHLRETRPLIKTCLTNLDYERNYLLRSKGGYLPYPNYGNAFLNSFFPFMSKKWNNLNSSIQAKDLFEFKYQLKSEMKPAKIKHFSTGFKLTNSLVTRFRTGRTSLNLHKYTIGQIDDPSCDCHFREESPLHYMIDCFLYTAERRTLFSLVEHYVPKFLTMNKKCKYELLISGLKIDNPDYFDLNKKITFAVQNYITQTKRFLQPR